MDNIILGSLRVYNTDTKEYWQDKVFLFPEDWTNEQVSDALYKAAFVTAQVRGRGIKKLHLKCDVCITQTYMAYSAMRQVLNLQDPDVTWVITEETLHP